MMCWTSQLAAQSISFLDTGTWRAYSCLKNLEMLINGGFIHRDTTTADMKASQSLRVVLVVVLLAVIVGLGVAEQATLVVEVGSHL